MTVSILLRLGAFAGQILPRFPLSFVVVCTGFGVTASSYGAAPREEIPVVFEM